MPPLVIDQATSAKAFITLAEAAKAQSPIAHCMAIDETGAITTDPVKAMLGALLPFGGYKGGNVALIVEMLAAGLSGAAWSLDAGHFLSGEHPVNAGMTVIALFPAAADSDFPERAKAQLERLRSKESVSPGTERSPQASRKPIVSTSTSACWKRSAACAVSEKFAAQLKELKASRAAASCRRPIVRAK